MYKVSAEEKINHQVQLMRCSFDELEQIFKNSPDSGGVLEWCPGCYRQSVSIYSLCFCCWTQASVSHPRKYSGSVH